MTDDLIGAYEELPYPMWRVPGEDTVRIGKARNHIPVLLEVDVTEAKAALARRKQQGGPDVSFTAWAVKCIAQAASEHRRVHAVRRRGPAGLGGIAGRGRLVLFRDVDVSLAVYRRLAGDEEGERLPMPFVVRKVNEKGLEALAAEIREAQSRPLTEEQQWIDPATDVPPPRLARLALAAPYRLRAWLFWNRLLGDPFRVKKTMGTVMVTSVPLSSKSGGGAWGIPAGLHPLLVALGAVGRRPGMAGDEIEPRDVLSMTVLFDHDVVDGMPVALFLRRLSDLMENASGL
jgi:pyruvate/2-oxoglutarate dehydrogenase complex dihydrolipoamide acyltransferase (E2) component